MRKQFRLCDCILEPTREIFDMRSYEELSTLKTFDERFEYLKLDGSIGDSLFGHNRYLNQMFYQSSDWKRVRNKAIIRDNGCDLGIEGREIHGLIYVHHLNPITIDDLIQRRPCLLDLNNLICVSRKTHTAITLGDRNLLESVYHERTLYDTCPWKQ